MDVIVGYPDLQGFAALGSGNAGRPSRFMKNSVSRRLDFPERWMEKTAPNAY
jgi:hypothetical protein